MCSVNEHYYLAAMEKYMNDYNAKNYDNARHHANHTFKLKPNDSEAIKLRDDAQGQLDLASANNQKYQAAMKEGLRAFEGKVCKKDVSHANVALGIRPGYRAANKMRIDATGLLDFASVD